MNSSNVVMEEVDENTVVPGQRVIISNDILYTGSTSTVGIKKTNATYYIYDGIEMSGRYRVTSSIAYVGKGMKYVSGWVDKKIIFNKNQDGLIRKLFSIKILKINLSKILLLNIFHLNLVIK